MLLLTHTITGAIIGQKVGNPIVVILLAFASHFLLDWIPHWSYDVPKKFSSWEFLKILPDVIPSALVFIVFIYCYPTQWLTIILGVIASALPDFLTLTSYIPGLRSVMKKFNRWHAQLQVHDERLLGLLTQIVYIGLLITILLAV